MAACENPSPPFPPQFPRDLRAAPNLPGLANPPLEGVRLARLSSVHRVKRSVCPKEPVNTSHSDVLHSTANVKPHYPPPEWSPRPNFHQWSQSLVPVQYCGVPFDAKPPHFWQVAEGFVAVRHKAKKLWQFFRICSDRSQKKTRFGENELKMQPKLSTGYSHAALLNKV